MPTFPGPESAALLEELGRYVLADPWPFAVDLAGCRGMNLRTVEGTDIVDWTGFYGSKLLGHNHPRMRDPAYVESVLRAASTRVANPDFLTPECLAYYRLLHRIAPRCMRNPRLEVYVVNSGAEAVENGMKYLIHRFEARCLRQGRQPAVRRFVYFDRAFHGRTIGALNVTRLQHDPVVTRGFEGFIPGNIRVPFPHVDTSRPASANEQEVDKALETVAESLDRYAGEVVGIVVEPLQGAGGHRVSLPRFFQELSRLAHRHEVGLAFDEVQTAGGTTGEVFAVDLLDLPHPPDTVAAAKKLGNGVVYMREPMEDRGVLDSTWGGSLVDMVRFCHEWQIVEDERLLEQVPAKTEALVQGLTALVDRYPELIFNVRGLGLYQGFSLRSPDLRTKLLSAALGEESVLLLGAGAQSVRLRPVLDVTHQEIAELLQVLDRCLQRLRS